MGYKLWHVLVLASSILLFSCSEDPDILFSKAKTEADLGSRQKALNYLFEIQNSHPDFTEAYLFAAQLFFENNNLSEAVNQCKLGLDAEADSSEIFRYLGKMYYNSGDTEIGYQYIQMALDVNPANVEVQISIGTILISKNLYDQALPHFNLALELDSANYIATVRKARIFVNLKRTAEAIVLLEAAIKDEPTRGLAYAILAYAQESTSAEEKTILENYALAVKHDPKNKTAWYYYGKFIGRFKTRDVQTYMEFVTAIKNYRSHFPEDIWGRGSLAWAYLELAELDSPTWLEVAKQQCEQVLAIDGDDHWSHYLLGRLYLLQKKPRLALLEAQLAFEIEPLSRYLELIDRAKLYTN